MRGSLAGSGWRATEALLLAYLVALFTISGNPTWTRLENAIGYGLVFCFLLSLFLERRWIVWWPRELSWVVAFLGWGLLVTLGALHFGGDPGAIGSQVMRIWTFAQVVVLSFVTLNVLQRSGRLATIEWGFSAGVILSLLMIFSAGDAGWRADRFGGGLRQANDLGLALGVAAAICTVQVARILTWSAGDRHRSLGLTILLLIQLTAVLLNVLATGSRQGMVTSSVAFLGTVGLLAYRGVLRRSRRALWGSLATAVALIWAAPRVAASPFLERIVNGVRFVARQELVANERSLAVRGQLIEEGLGLWSLRPVSGWGFDAFRLLSREGTYTHSNPVELLANFGVVGFLLFHGALVLLVCRAWRAWKGKYLPAWAAGGAIFLVGILFLNGLAAVTYYEKTHWLLFGYALALVAWTREEPGPIESRDAWRQSVAHPNLNLQHG